MARILLVEGEPAVAEPLVRALARAGHSTLTVRTGDEGIAHAEARAFDLMLIDATLPDADGHDVCQALHLRLRGPVVVLADDREQADRDAWRDGAEDYLVKPVDGGELVAMVRAVLRRWRPDDAATRLLRVGPLELDPVSRHVRLDGRTLKLTPKLVAILMRLMRSPGDVVGRDELTRDVWGEPQPGRTLDAHVRMLRAALGDDAAHPRLVHTVRGVGFCLSAPEAGARAGSRRSRSAR